MATETKSYGGSRIEILPSTKNLFLRNWHSVDRIRDRVQSSVEIVPFTVFDKILIRTEYYEESRLKSGLDSPVYSAPYKKLGFYVWFKV